MSGRKVLIVVGLINAKGLQFLTRVLEGCSFLVHMSVVWVEAGFALVVGLTDHEGTMARNGLTKACLRIHSSAMGIFNRFESNVCSNSKIFLGKRDLWQNLHFMRLDMSN